MPTNVPPDYLKAEEEYRKAKTPEDKLSALEKMMALMPKHKGTEKLQADLKRRMAKLRAGEGKSATARRGGVFHVPREGAAQVILVGAPNAGKSALIVRLTRAELLVGPNVLEELDTVVKRLQEGKVELVRETESKLTPEGRARVRAMLVGTHLDRPEAGENREALSELYANQFPM